MNGSTAGSFAAAVVYGLAEWVEMNAPKSRLTYYNRVQSTARVFSDTIKVVSRDVGLVFRETMQELYDLSNEFTDRDDLVHRLRVVADGVS